MNKKDIRILEKYAQAIYGCQWDDLEDKEQTMLIYYVREHEPGFENHYGLMT